MKRTDSSRYVEEIQQLRRNARQAEHEKFSQKVSSRIFGLAVIATIALVATAASAYSPELVDKVLDLETYSTPNVIQVVSQALKAVCQLLG